MLSRQPSGSGSPDMKHEHLEHDLGDAAFLVVKGFRLIGLVPGGQGHYSFEFEDPGGRAREAAMDYLRGEPVSARELVNAQKSLKNLLYNAKSPRNGHDNGNSNRTSRNSQGKQ